jgi:hypothetical protein
MAWVFYFRAALELLKEIRLKAQSNAGAANDRGLDVFGLGAVFVDERVVLQLSPAKAQAGVNEVIDIFSEGAEEERIPLHTVPLESIYENDYHKIKDSESVITKDLNGIDGIVDTAEQKLLKLFQGVKDATGREDLVEYLRMQAIQKVTICYLLNSGALMTCCSSGCAVENTDMIHVLSHNVTKVSKWISCFPVMLARTTYAV